MQKWASSDMVCSFSPRCCRFRDVMSVKCDCRMKEGLRFNIFPQNSFNALIPVGAADTRCLLGELVGVRARLDIDCLSKLCLKMLN